MLAVRLARPVVLGDTKNVAAEHYIYALTEYRKIDPQPALARLCT